MTFSPYGGTSPLQAQAATPPAGFPLQNGTPNILQWTAPNDGQQHRVTVFASLQVTSAETGGQVSLVYFLPSGAGSTHTIFAAGLANGTYAASTQFNVIVEAGSVVTVQQLSALTVGAATVWAEIWGS